MRQIELEFAPLAGAKGLDLTFVRCSLVVRSDRRLLRRLVQNLVSNAIKYTPDGRVLVGCRRRGDHLRIDVYDTGVGIPESQQRDIFVEFHRLDQGARIARGLGLGLSIVERVARVLGCEIEVDSAVGRGSRFSVMVAALERGGGRPAGARRHSRRSQPARRHHRALHRQRTRGARRHGDHAARLGLRGDQGARSCRRAGGDRGKPDHAERAAGRLPSRPRQRHRGDRGAAGALRRPAGDPDHRRPLAAGARAGARAKAFSCCTSRSSRPRCARCWRNGACCAWRRRSRLANRSSPEEEGRAKRRRSATSVHFVILPAALARPPLSAGMNGEAQLAAGAPCDHWPVSILAAAITAWVRLSTPSFCRMAETCAFTVASETPS